MTTRRLSRYEGVKQTLTIETFKPPHHFQPLGGVAVIADNTCLGSVSGAQGSKDRLGHQAPTRSTKPASICSTLESTVRQPGKVARDLGDVDAEFAKAGKSIEADYYVPHLAHASMETPVAVAEFGDGKVTAWAPTQDPQAAQETIAEDLGITKEDVICHVTLLGGGFGRKSKPDYVAEAAILSKALARPVKVVWSREDDIRFDYYHAVSAMYMKAAVDANGKPTAWLQRHPPILRSVSTFNVNATYALDEMSLGWNNLPFKIPNHRGRDGPADAHVRIGWLRSVANVYHAFAIHSFADELANAANQDSVQYLLELIGPPRIVPLKAEPKEQEEQKRYPLDTARLRRVVELAAEIGRGKHRERQRARIRDRCTPFLRNLRRYRCGS